MAVFVKPGVEPASEPERPVQHPVDATMENQRQRHHYGHCLTGSHDKLKKRNQIASLARNRSEYQTKRIDRNQDPSVVVQRVRTTRSVGVSKASTPSAKYENKPPAPHDTLEHMQERSVCQPSEQVHLRVSSDHCSAWKVEQHSVNSSQFFALGHQQITILRAGFYQVSLKLPERMTCVGLMNKPVLFCNNKYVACFKNPEQTSVLSEMVQLNAKDVLHVGLLRDLRAFPPCQLSLLGLHMMN